MKVSTKVRTKLSKKNKYYISNDRRLELEHFCRQYPEWRKAYISLENYGLKSPIMSEIHTDDISDPTARVATLRVYYAERMKMVEDAANDAEPNIAKYILKAVTENLSYPEIKARLDIPCGKDMFYDRCRKFYWILSGKRK